MSTSGDKPVEDQAPSARDHEYREIKLTIWPTTAGARYAVQVRVRRGDALRWDRRLCTDGLDRDTADGTSTQSGVLRAVAAACLRAAAAMDGH